MGSWKLCCFFFFYWCAGSGVVRAHAPYAVDPGLNPGQLTFAACHTPSFPHFIINPLSKRCLCLKNDSLIENDQQFQLKTSSFVLRSLLLVQQKCKRFSLKVASEERERIEICFPCWLDLQETLRLT